MIFFEPDGNDPYYNLAVEEFFFEKMDKRESYFLLWQNSNTIVIGKYQNAAEEINREYVEKNNIKVARRLSGGGAVYHDMGNLNFTFITDQKNIDAFNFGKFVVPVINTLKKIGVNAEFTGRNDITIDGLKFSGNSQYVKKGRVMHHGCIMLDTDLNVVSQALQVKEAKFESKSVKSVKSRVTTINNQALRKISMDEFKKLLKEEIFKEDMQVAILTDNQLKEIEELRNKKYATWEWNYGKSPKYNMRKEKKFEGGLVTVYLKSSNGKIDDIKFYGDFFGNGDIEELENKLFGAKLDEDLRSILNEIDIDRYMKNITAEDICSLLLR